MPCRCTTCAFVRGPQRCDVPGQVLFQYVDEDGRHPIRSNDVNEYLRDLDADVSAKDYRTLCTCSPPPPSRSCAPRSERCRGRHQRRVVW
jgi:hypothetical protein